MAAGSRPAYRLVARPRPLAARRPRKQGARSDAGGVLVDADYRHPAPPRGTSRGAAAEPHRAERGAAGPAQAVDHGLFQPLRRAGGGAQIPFSGPGVGLPGLGGDAVRAAAGVAATAMGFAVRHWPLAGTAARAMRPPADAGPGGPRPEGLGPADDDLINLLHRTGRARQAFTAEVREWLDGDFSPARSRGDGVPAAGPGRHPGPGRRMGRPASRAETSTRTCASGWRPRAATGSTAGRRLPSAPGTTACDGERQWLVRGTKVTFWDALPLPRELARLADPAWLLAGLPVRAGGETEVGGRRGRWSWRTAGQTGPTQAGGRPPWPQRTGPEQAAPALRTQVTWASAGSTRGRARWRRLSIRT